ncbi:MAG: hypothetical protein D3909_18425, partial [Candidatus Electrothrix sp. ATG1]|nr:hypothetical protein [Candidatus Electrothrix sp. ATG1]
GRYSSSDQGKEGPIYDKVLEGYTIENLQEYIAGSGCKTAADSRSYVTGLDGWYHVFHDPRERNLSSPLLFAERVFFATYQPYNDKCKAEGTSYFYLLDFVAGTGAWDNEVIMPNSSADGAAGEKQFDPSKSYDGTKSGKDRYGSGGAGDLGGGGKEGDVLHDFKTQVRGLANISSAGGSGSGGEFYAKDLDPVDRESNKLNWSDRCGVTD